ncbi:MAG: uracil-DNA glycosylase [Sedimenticola sp.]|nr:uracil-DNA glycosylase [Sedimenticola sp.]
MKEGVRQAYLEAMGIQSWRSRDAFAEASVSADSEIGEIAESAGTLPAAAVTLDSRRPQVEQTSPAVSHDGPPDWLDDIPLPDQEYAASTGLDDVTEGGGTGFDQEDGISRLDWGQLEAKVAACTKCELHQSRTQTVFGVGHQTADLMIIGEAPGVEEDRKGEPFVGRAGQLLTAMLRAIGLQRDQVYIANILKCRPPGNRDPRAEESLQCAAYLQRQIALVNPKVILAVGAVAARNLLQSDEAVGRLRGQTHHIKGIPVVVSYHPAYLLRSPDQKAKAWQDLQKAASILR